ncbi:uncharacterized protein LOC128745729 [Sabethes cyaneus]|uniref:uncharacterized protein LOC128745729 n=1 Tax=Sabethes cyaneus TaxID=53552 RepID=UPI00237DA347|nr:uncharacterized protein LOC128745729 [Sabethes cyaneus]
MNDLPEYINDAFVLVYADDVKLFYPVKNSIDCCKLQADLDNFKTFCDRCGLMINTSKCCVLTFSHKVSNVTHHYHIGDFDLQRSDTVRDLGVIMDKKLSFNAHIDGVISKAFSMFGVVKRYANDFDDPYTIVTLYTALVRSSVEYAGIVWTPQYTIHKQRLERVQKKFVRFALRNLGWRDGLAPYVDLCRLINLNSLDCRRKINDVLFLKDLLTERFYSPYLLSQVTFNEGNRNLRRVRQFQLPTRNTNYSMNEPVRRMMSMANDVQNVASILDSRQTIRDKLKVHFM